MFYRREKRTDRLPTGNQHSATRVPSGRVDQQLDGSGRTAGGEVQEKTKMDRLRTKNGAFDRLAVSQVPLVRGLHGGRDGWHNSGRAEHSAGYGLLDLG